MTRRVLMLMAMVGVMAGLQAQESGDLTVILNSYLAIHDQLANDKIDGVKAPAEKILAEANKLGERGTSLAQAAKAMTDPADLEGARKAFGPLSDAVIAATQNTRGDVKVAFCPMVNRSWLQKESTIRNPYYGATMLTCGEFRGAKIPDPAAR